MEKWRDTLKSDNALVRYKSKQFIELLQNAEPIEELDMALFFSIIEKMKVYEDEKMKLPNLWEFPGGKVK